MQIDRFPTLIFLERAFADLSSELPPEQRDSFCICCAINRRAPTPFAARAARCAFPLELAASLTLPRVSPPRLQPVPMAFAAGLLHQLPARSHKERQPLRHVTCMVRALPFVPWICPVAPLQPGCRHLPPCCPCPHQVKYPCSCCWISLAVAIVLSFIGFRLVSANSGPLGPFKIGVDYPNFDVIARQADAHVLAREESALALLGAVPAESGRGGGFGRRLGLADTLEDPMDTPHQAHVPVSAAPDRAPVGRAPRSRPLFSNSHGAADRARAVRSGEAHACLLLPPACSQPHEPWLGRRC